MLKRTVIFALIHMVVLLGCTYVFLILKTERTMKEGAVQSQLEFTTEMAVKVLSLPGRFVKNAWPAQMASEFLEWVVFIANSLVWGGLLAFVYTKVTSAT